jgi:hypothetical protein
VKDWNNQRRVFKMEPKPAGTAGRSGFDLQAKMGLRGTSKPANAKEATEAKKMSLFYDQLEVSL